VQAQRWAGGRTSKKKYKMPESHKPDGAVAESSKRLASRYNHGLNAPPIRYPSIINPPYLPLCASLLRLIPALSFFKALTFWSLVTSDDIANQTTRHVCSHRLLQCQQPSHTEERHTR